MPWNCMSILVVRSLPLCDEKKMAFGLITNPSAPVHTSSPSACAAISSTVTVGSEEGSGRRDRSSRMCDGAV